ncbi:MAG: response regulator transcription factor [Trueperaceae bacterium]|nr:response regulator transcription factor [Trueperaceae bacterium]
MIQVVVVDDHALVRRGLATVLDATRDLRVVAAYADGRDFLREARSLGRIDVLLLDVTMRHVDGLEVLARVRTWRTPPPTLLLSMHPERRYAVQAVREGAAGYLTKDVGDDELVRALRTVAYGGRYLSDSATAWLLRDEADGDRDAARGLDALSDRERKVMRLLQLGLTLEEIAYELELAASTVSTYKGRLMRKLGAKSLVDLLRFGDAPAAPEGAPGAGGVEGSREA